MPGAGLTLPRNHAAETEMTAECSHIPVGRLVAPCQPTPCVRRDLPPLESRIISDPWLGRFRGAPGERVAPHSPATWWSQNVMVGAVGVATQTLPSIRLYEVPTSDLRIENTSLFPSWHLFHMNPPGMSLCWPVRSCGKAHAHKQPWANDRWVRLLLVMTIDHQLGPRGGRGGLEVWRSI